MFLAQSPGHKPKPVTFLLIVKAAVSRRTGDYEPLRIQNQVPLTIYD